MADVRALLAAERQARRVSHPYLTYTKTGALICNVCQLNVKSETLWEGHLRSLNHKKNVQKKTQESSNTRRLKRKLTDVDEEEEDLLPVDTGRRKIVKSRAVSLAEKEATADIEQAQPQAEDIPPVPPVPSQANQDEPQAVQNATKDTAQPEPAVSPTQTHAAQPVVDEDEYAAFEREIAADLEDAAVTSAPDYSGATISAAPLSAEELAKQRAEDKRKHQEILAEDEQEDERGRIEEEFEIMEEFEERVKRLKERREALRAGTAVPNAESDLGAVAEATMAAQEEAEVKEDNAGESSSDDEDEDEDDWYG